MRNRGIHFRKSAIAGCLMMGLMLIASGSLYAQSPVIPPGSGTYDAPYLISEIGHLVWMGDTVAGSGGMYYTMTADIDASDTANWNDDGTDTDLLEGFKPIGTFETPFTGIFEGDLHTVAGLVINRPNEDYVGLFGRVGEGGDVLDVGVVDCAVTGNDFVGGLIGNNYYTSYAGTEVSFCYVTGTVTGLQNVGGLIGSKKSGSVEYCYSTGTVTGSSLDVGGLIGYAGSCEILECYSTSDVNGAAGATYAGGLIGRIKTITLSDSYASGAVSGTVYVGGLVGYFYGGIATEISNCYSTGSVSGPPPNTGGLIGYKAIEGTVSNSYWDWQSSGITVSAAGMYKSTAQMKQQATFLDWAFDDIWGIVENETYPYLLNLTDLDGDGVIYGLDECPDTVPGATVDTYGCPPVIPGDFDGDGDVDAADFDRFSNCFSGPTIPYGGACSTANFDLDNDVDQSDFGVFQKCYSGENLPADPDCAN